MRYVASRDGLAAAALGALLALSATFGPRPVLAFAFFPLWCALIDRGEPSPRRGLVLGWVAGFTCNIVVFVWIEGLLERFGGFPWYAAVPVATLLWWAQGLAFGLVGWLTECGRLAGLPLWLVVPPAVTVVFAWAPALFPWRPTAGAIGWLEWAQMAELGGAPLLDAVMALGGCSVYEALRRQRRRALPLAFAAATLAIPLAYGSVQVDRVAERRAQRPLLRIGVVQPNVPIEMKGDPRLAFTHLRLLRRMTRHLERSGADVVVWPESAYPYPLPRGATSEHADGRAILRDGVRGPIITGAITRAGRCDRWNSVVALGHDGRIHGVSDKVQLLHFGETVPLWELLPPLQEMFPCPGLRAGERAETLALDGVRYGVLNCYEDVLPEHARTVSAGHPDVLVNVTNDAWFGDTREPHLHQLVSRLRAIETRRDLVRAVNTGVSSHVAATGATLLETGTFVESSFVAETRLMEGVTPWVRHGDLVTPALAGALLGAIAARRRSHRSIG